MSAQDGMDGRLGRQLVILPGGAKHPVGFAVSSGSSSLGVHVGQFYKTSVRLCNDREGGFRYRWLQLWRKQAHFHKPKITVGQVRPEPFIPGNSSARHCSDAVTSSITAASSGPGSSLYLISHGQCAARGRNSVVRMTALSDPPHSFALLPGSPASKRAFQPSSATPVPLLPLKDKPPVRRILR